MIENSKNRKPKDSLMEEIKTINKTVVNMKGDKSKLPPLAPKLTSGYTS